jgi:hypothetical protein
MQSTTRWCLNEGSTVELYVRSEWGVPFAESKKSCK